jgi:DNA topoisomerase-2
MTELVVSSVTEHMKTKGMWAGGLERSIIPDLLGARLLAGGAAGAGAAGAAAAGAAGAGAAIAAAAGAAGAASEASEVSDAASDASEAGDSSEAAASSFASEICIVEIQQPHTPALMKGFDETLVNAIDWCKNKIDVTFDKATGRVTVFNDGAGVPTGLHAAQSAAAGRPVYIPEVAFCVPLAGTNIEKAHDSVKGGTNGIGAKLTNVHSVEFSVETVAAATAAEAAAGEAAASPAAPAAKSKKPALQLYKQTYRDRLSVIEPAVITAAPKGARPYTRVSFVPAYAALGYATPLSAADADDLDCWLRLRTYQAAAYKGAGVAVSYNGARCGATDAAGLAAAVLAAAPGGGAVYAARATAAAEPWRSHPWGVAVVVLAGPAKRARVSAATMAVVNGVMTNRGTHATYLRSQVSEAVNARLKAAGAPAAGPAEALAAVRIVMVGAVPGAEWSGQRKDELQVGARDVAQWPVLPAKFLKEVGAAIAAGLLRAAPAAAAKAVVHDKYTPARYAGKAQRAQTLLFTAEGDSAITLVRAGLTQQRGASLPGGPSLDWCGIISLQGVIINAKREVTQFASAPANQAQTETETKDAKEPADAPETIAVRSARLRDNKRLAALADAFGLRYDYKYESAAELATLRYGKLVLCVDQDLDGTGKIAALVLVWLHEFWPALLRNGRVGRFMTPLVRAYPKGKAARLADPAAAGAPAAAPAAAAGAPAKKSKKAAGAAAATAAAAAGAAAQDDIVEFFYEEELRAWLEEDPARAAAYTIKYYKGLATHDDAEMRRMFAPARFAASLYTYAVDDAAATARLFEVYFGADPALRKAVLVTPVAHLGAADARALHAARALPVGRVQLDIDTKSYKNDAIKRQIPCAVDGLNPARRKILAGAFARFAGEAAGKEVKVFQLGGFTADRMFYHHGDASLNATIVNMAQAFPGARRYALLDGVGQFGSRHGDAAGSPRYISVRLAAVARALFPSADRWHLPYVFEDGARAEPLWFAPVAPLAALESASNISEGWNHDSFARRLDAVLALADAYIGGDPDLHAAAAALEAADGAPPPALAAQLAALAVRWPLPAETAGFAGRVADYRGAPHSFGVYTYDTATRTVTVTELPIGEATGRVVERLRAMADGGAAKPAAASKPASKAAAKAAPKAAKKQAIIESVRDCSTSDSVRLEVVLAPGAYEALVGAPAPLAGGAAPPAASPAAGGADPIEEALGLRRSMRPHLNYYSHRGGVVELPNSEAGYLAAVLCWAPRRAEVYRRRLERELVVAELAAVEEEAALRYIGEAAALDLARLANDAAAAEVLRVRGYPPLDANLFRRPEYTPAAELRRRATTPPALEVAAAVSQGAVSQGAVSQGAVSQGAVSQGAVSQGTASYDYLLNMRARDLVQAAAEAGRARLATARAAAATARARLAEAPIAGASVWRAEIAEFRKVVTQRV